MVGRSSSPINPTGSRRLPYSILLTLSENCSIFNRFLISVGSLNVESERSDVTRVQSKSVEEGCPYPVATLQTSAGSKHHVSYPPLCHDIADCPCSNAILQLSFSQFHAKLCEILRMRRSMQSNLYCHLHHHPTQHKCR